MKRKLFGSINDYIYRNYYPIKNIRDLFLYYIHIIIGLAALLLYIPFRDVSEPLSYYVFFSFVIFYIILCVSLLYFHVKIHTNSLYLKNYQNEYFIDWTTSNRSIVYKSAEIPINHLKNCGYEEVDFLDCAYYKKIDVNVNLNLFTTYTSKNIVILICENDILSLECIPNEFCPNDDVYILCVNHQKTTPNMFKINAIVKGNRQLTLQYLYEREGSIHFYKPLYIHIPHKKTIKNFLKNGQIDEPVIPENYLSNIITEELYHLVNRTIEPRTYLQDNKIF